MRRLIPKSLAGQMIALLLITLVAAQAVSLMIFADERRLALRAAAREQVLSRTASMAHLLNDTPSTYHRRIVAAASTPQLRFSLSQESSVASEDALEAAHPLMRHLADLLADAAREVRISVVDEHGSVLDRFREGRRKDGHDKERGRRDDDHDDDDDDDGDDGHWDHRHGPWRLGLKVSLLLPAGDWLNVATVVPLPSPAWAWASLLSMAVVAMALSLVVILMVRRITRPMQRLAVASEALGRGAATAPLPEVGPREVRRTTAAFNLMRARLERYVGDRTRMLAAVSHDLRTPITTLRLRAEFIEDGEVRAKILDTLDEMQRMTEELLAFVREEATQEGTRRVDLAALVESLAADLAEIGLDVDFAAAQQTPYACRPAGLKRALRNVIENAVTYGQRARLRLEETADDLVVVIDDDGPGIAQENFERVFEPFVRLEELRSRETGGIGLGLAIARSIVRGHGGDITLENRPEGGLRLRVLLPKETKKP